MYLKAIWLVIEFWASQPPQPVTCHYSRHVLASASECWSRVRNALARYIWLLICKGWSMCICACVTCWRRIYGLELQAEKHWISVHKSTQMLHRNSFQRDQRVIVLCFCSRQSPSLAISQTLVPKKMEVQRGHLMSTSYIRASVFGASVYIV